MDNENHLALELLQEVKASARRWFIISIVELFVITALILILLLVPQESVEIENQDGNANYIGNDMNGDINNGENQSDKEMERSKDQEDKEEITQCQPQIE